MLHFGALGTWCVDLYKNFFQKDASTLLPSLLHYQNNKIIFEEKYTIQFKNPLEFWDYASSVHKELADLAMLLLKVCPHAAGVERFWSWMKSVHTDVRNSMKTGLVAGVCAVKMQLAKDGKKAAKAEPARDVEPHDGIMEIIQINSAVR